MNPPNEPAFPLAGMPFYLNGIPQSISAGYGYDREPQPGMSIRDYFAAQALTGLLAQDSDDHGHYYAVYEDDKGNETPAAKHYTHGPDGSAPNKPRRTAEQNIATKAYALADAMLTARNP